MAKVFAPFPLGDITAPELLLPTGTKTGTTTADGTVYLKNTSGQNSKGWLYSYASTNSFETRASVLASGSNQLVSGDGAQSVSITGLSSGTTYYLHYVYESHQGAYSDVTVSDSFTTDGAGGNTLTASQTEALETNAATLNVLMQLTASQTEVIETNSATMQLLIQLAAAQTEALETNSASIVGVETRSLTAAQTEALETNAATMQLLMQLTAAQTEGLESNSAIVQLLMQLTAAQTEQIEAQSATILTTDTALLAANQTEQIEAQSAVLDVLVQVAANQTETNETNAAGINVLVQLTAAQIEEIETNSAAMQALVKLTAAQIEALEANTATIIVGEIIIATDTKTGLTRLYDIRLAFGERSIITSLN